MSEKNRTDGMAEPTTKVLSLIEFQGALYFIYFRLNTHRLEIASKLVGGLSCFFFGVFCAHSSSASDNLSVEFPGFSIIFFLERFQSGLKKGNSNQNRPTTKALRLTKDVTELSRAVAQLPGPPAGGVWVIWW